MTDQPGSTVAAAPGQDSASAPTGGSPDAATAADHGFNAAELARRHGLSVSGARPGLASYTRQLWSRRHFIVTFATAKLAATYSTARLGQLWQVVTPLVNAAVYFVIFGVLIGTRGNIENYIAYLCVGIFIFNFTQQAVQSGTRSIPDNLGLIRALHFPRACLPLATTVVQFQQLIFSMIVLAAIMLLTGEPPTLDWLLVVPVLALQFVFNAGLVMIVARLAAKTTDLSQVMPFVMRTWLYASGVFYSLDAVTEHLPPAVATILSANPALVYIDLMRYALMESAPADTVSGGLWVMALAWALVMGIGGYLFFWQAEEAYGRG